MKKINWIKIVSRRHSLFRLDLLDRGCALKVEQLWGIKHDDQMFISSPKLNAWYCSKEKIDKFSKVIFKKANQIKNFSSQVAKDTEIVCLNLVKESKKLATGNLKKLTNQDLALRLKIR